VRFVVTGFAKGFVTLCKKLSVAVVAIANAVRIATAAVVKAMLWWVSENFVSCSDSYA
jgi:hypothetical protein